MPGSRHEGPVPLDLPQVPAREPEQFGGPGRGLGPESGGGPDLDRLREGLTAVRGAVEHGLARAAAGGTLVGSARTARIEELIGEALDDLARTALRSAREPLTAQQEGEVRRTVLDELLGLGRLGHLLEDRTIETININGADHVHIQYRDGLRRQEPPVAGSDQQLIAMLRALGASGAHERRFDRGAPELSMQLPGGQRLFAVMDVTDRVSVSIRQHWLGRISLDDLVERGEVSWCLAKMLAATVRARFNIVVSGGPAAGKTTLLRALAAAIPSRQRVITIEDAYELALSREEHPDLVAMQTREPNIEGAGGIDMARLLRSTLRMTPDRVIVGEVRGPEVVQMAKAMSIGIDGSMATVHASSSRQALDRLVGYAMEPPANFPRGAATALIAQAVHYVVHLDQTPTGVRVVSSVREVVDFDAETIVTNEVYRPGPDRGGTPGTQPRRLQALVEAGFDPDLMAEDGW